MIDFSSINKYNGNINNNFEIIIKTLRSDSSNKITLEQLLTFIEDNIDIPSGGTESDPIFTASDAFNITSSDISNWDDAYSWGDHSLVGYLTSFSETDPLFTTWLAGPPDISEFNNDTGFITSSALSSYVPTSRTLTINGTSQDLSTNRTWTVGDVLTSGSYADPSWITSLAYSKIVSIVVASSDVTDNNTNTLKDFTDLVLPVVAGNTYYIYAFGHYNSSSTAVGSRWTLNGPAVTFLSYESSYSLSAVNHSINQGLSSYQLPASFNSTSAATTGNTFEIKGLIKPSADGNLQVQFACETSLGSITAKAGSFLQLIQIA